MTSLLLSTFCPSVLEQLQTFRVVRVAKYLLRRTQSNCVNLMKNRVMHTVNFVTSVHVPDNEEIIQSHRNQLDLMRGGVRPQQRVLIYKVTIGFLSTRMILRYEKGVKVLRDGNYGTYIVVDTERRGPAFTAELSIKVIHDALT